MDEPNGSLDINRFKSLTGGGSIIYRGLYEEPQETHLNCTFIISCNNFPKLSTYDNGLFRRIVCLDWPNKFVANPT